MLGKSVHIPGSRFRHLPNPCAESWTPGLDIAACLSAFSITLKDPSLQLDGDALTKETQDLFEHGRIDGLLLTQGQSLSQKIKAYMSANDTLEEEKVEKCFWPVDERENRKIKAAQRHSEALLDLLDSLHFAVQKVDERLEDMMDEVRIVVTSHFATWFERRHLLKNDLTHQTEHNPKEKNS